MPLPMSYLRVPADFMIGHDVLVPASAAAVPFDRVIFNFPHVPGKNNIRHNRGLLTAFLSSAFHVLADRGEVLVALCQGQVGRRGEPPCNHPCSS